MKYTTLDSTEIAKLLQVLQCKAARKQIHDREHRKGIKNK